MKDDAGYLEDIVNEVRKCQDFMRDIAKVEFDSSFLHQYAVAKIMENIGEASNKLTKELKDANQGVGWSRLARTRNQLIHNYSVMDPNALWHAATNTLPRLAEQVSKMIAPPGNDDLDGHAGGSSPTSKGPRRAPADKDPPKGKPPGGSAPRRPTSRKERDWER